jgi:large subunit ribosomal protein L3
MVGLLGKKLGMTHIFDERGDFVPITLIQTGPCPVLAVKDKSLQLGFDYNIKEKNVKKPQLEFFRKINVKPVRFIREVPISDNEDFKVGQEIKCDIFRIGDFVDVTGISIGKGFQGGVKRWGWKGGPQSHGSMSHRRIGSMGSTTSPGRVWKGKHLPGHMGNKKVTLQNLRVMKVDTEKNILAVKGAVPGHKNGYLVIKKAIKKM